MSSFIAARTRNRQHSALFSLFEGNQSGVEEVEKEKKKRGGTVIRPSSSSSSSDTPLGHQQEQRGGPLLIS